MKSHLVSYFCAGTLLAMAPMAAQAAVFPHAEDFNDGVANNFITAGSGGIYTVTGQPGVYGYQASVNSTGPLNGSTAISITAVASTGYEISTKFTLSSFSGTGAANVGVGFLGDSADFSAGTQYRLLYQLAGSDAGRIHLFRNGSVISYSTGSIAPAVGQEYTIKVRVIPANGSYIIRGTLSAGTASIATETSQATLHTGSYFGYRTAVNASNVNVIYDDFSVHGTETDLLVTGGLTVLGDTDLVGNTLKLGGTGSGDEAVKVDYTETESANTLTTVATRESAVFTWAENGASTTKPKMTLGSGNTLTLFDASGSPSIWLNPQEVELGGGIQILGNLYVGGGISLGNGSQLLTWESADVRYIRNSDSPDHGNDSVALNGSIATGDQSTAMSSGTALGWLSTAMTDGVASGLFSTAMSGGEASGQVSTALTRGVAWGFQSTAINEGTTHHGFSLAVGQGTLTYGDHQVVVGTYNVANEPTEYYQYADDVFVVGNGVPNARSTAFIVKRDGSIHVEGTSAMKGNVVVGTPEQVANLNVSGNTSISGNLTVSGTVSTAAGSYLQNSATGTNAFGLGSGEATGEGAFAVNNAWAWGDGSFAVTNGIAAGPQSAALTNGSAFGWGSTAITSGYAEGFQSTAIGPASNAKGVVQVVVGINNVPQGDALNWVPTDDLFVIGNGGETTIPDEVSPGVSSNALTVHKNGDLRVAGNVQSKGGFRTPPMGDLDMGDFKTGVNPAALPTDANPGMNAGLRYPNE
jgi:hypothetical protein